METFLWGLWNGLTAWPVLIVHVFGAWDGFPVYNTGRDTGWYQFSFLLGAHSPFLGAAGNHKQRSMRRATSRVASSVACAPPNRRH